MPFILIIGYLVGLTGVFTIVRQISDYRAVSEACAGF